MKRTIRYLTIPLHVWTHSDLTLEERALMIEIDSYSDSNGCSAGVQALASSLGLPSKTIKNTLKSLQSKGALEVRIDDDGAKRMFVYLYKERYVENPNAVVVGDKPSDVMSLSWDEIAEKWEDICSMLPKIAKWSPQRKNRVKTCLKSANINIEDLYKVFRLIASSSFLNGSKTDKWQCCFDWAIKPTNFIKIWEGNYHKDYSERQSYDAIMRGEEVNKQSQSEDSFYR